MRILVGILILTCPLWAQSNRRRGEQNPLGGRPEAVEAGKQTFLDACSPCHGPNGQGGRGPSLVTSREVRRASDQQLFNSIRNGVPGADMPPFPFPDEKTWQLVAFVRSLTAPAMESNVPGDTGAGRTLFFGKAGCSECHMIRGQGGFLGPDLSDIGAKSTLARLKESIVEPNVRLSEGFRSVTVKTMDGREIAGVAKHHTNYSIQILDAKGKLHLLSRSDLGKVEFREKSLMPDDYARRLSDEERQNLLAFLSRQSIRGQTETN